MKPWLLVFIGGGAGSCLRYLLWIYLNAGTIKWVPTITANLAGCAFLGILLAAQGNNQINESWYLLLGIGLCGGFTTFSTFSGELVSLVRDGLYLQGFGYLLLTVVLGFAMLLGTYKATFSMLN